jgi:hypothetical protein
MKTSKKIKTTAIFTLLIFALEIILFSPSAYPQSINRIDENIGGSGTNTTSGDSQNDNTLLYIVAGVIVVGLIVWKVFLDKKEPKTKNDVKTDSTKASLDTIFYNNLSERESELHRIQNQIPFEIFLGLKNNGQDIPWKNLTLGSKFKLCES